MPHGEYYNQEYKRTGSTNEMNNKSRNIKWINN